MQAMQVKQAMLTTQAMQLMQVMQGLVGLWWAPQNLGTRRVSADGPAGAPGLWRVRLTLELLPGGAP